MGGLHRFLDDGNEVLTQLREIDLIAQGGTEGSNGFGRIILAAVEAAVDELLDSTAQSLHEGSNDKGGDD